MTGTRGRLVTGARARRRLADPPGDRDGQVVLAQVEHVGAGDAVAHGLTGLGAGAGTVHALHQWRAVRVP